MSKYSVVGKRFARVDGLGKVTGRTAYLSDMSVPGMLEAAVLRSPIARGRIHSLNTSAAETMPGVRALLTPADVSQLRPWRLFPDSPQVQRILTDTPAFVGDAIAAVAADSREQAIDAVRTIEIAYDELKPIVSIDDALHAGVAVYDAAPDNLAGPTVEYRCGDVESAFAIAPHVIEGTYSTQRQCAQTIEPLGCICEWGDDGRLTIWTHLDNYFHFRESVAASIDIPPETIRVCAPEALGATFGLKNGLLPSLEPLCALLAKKAGRAVRLRLSPEESMYATVARHPSRIALKTAVSRDGKILAKQARIVLDAGAGGFGYAVARSMVNKWISLYPCENADFLAESVYTNHLPSGAYRGVGTAQLHFAMECQMDEIARLIDIDPVRLRQMNLVSKGYRLPGGTLIRSWAGDEVLRKGAHAFGWDSSRHRSDVPEGDNRFRRGVGMALGLHHAGMTGTIPGIEEGSKAAARLNADGTLSVITAVVDKGQGAITTFAAIAAETFGISMSDVSVEGTDSDTVPFDYMGAEASRSTYVMGRAIVDAVERLRSTVLSQAANMAQQPVTSLTIENGSIVSLRGTELWTLAQVARAAGGPPLQEYGSFFPQDSDPLPVIGAHFCEVEVDSYTGQVNVLRYLAVQDVGRVINRLGCEGQIEGGVHHGLGYALMEELIHDSDAQPVNPSFSGYKVLMASDMPEIQVLLIEAPDDYGGPYGAKGLGTAVIPAIAPAVANAVYSALGVPIRELPMTPYRVLDLTDRA